MFNQFRKNPKYLTQYHLKIAIALALLNLTLFFLYSPQLTSILLYVPILFLMASTNFRQVMSSFALAIACYFFLDGQLSRLIPIDLFLSVLIGLVVTSLLHNASHRNFRPLWLSRAIGEACGMFQLVGFPDWVILHVYHHANPDDPEKDPHPPGRETFLKYFLGMRQQILNLLLKEYFELWGKTPESGAELQRLSRVMRIEQLMKVTFWWFVLSPREFTWFFVPSIVFKMVHYAWFNYATHIYSQENQRMEIVNLDTGLYRAVNWVSFGLYYHQNHHTNAHAFNPKYVSYPKAERQKEAA